MMSCGQKLGSYLRISHGFAFKGEHFSESGMYVILTPGNFHESGGFRARPGRDRSYTARFPDRYLLRKNDLIVAMTEQGEGLLGSAAIIPEDGIYLHNQRIGLVSVDPKVGVQKFFFYLFNSSSIRHQIRNSSSGAKVRHTSPERIYQTSAPIPDVGAQGKIAAVLSAYDDLIENNRHRIALLERTAEQLYREWFVRFRFPGYQQAKFEKGVPLGWRTTLFGDLVQFDKGKNPDTLFDEAVAEALPYITVESIEKGNSSCTVPNRGSVRCAPEDILMLMDGARSGMVARGMRGIVGSTLAVLRTKPELKNLLFEYLNATNESIVFNNTGSAIPHASKAFIYRMLVRLPDDESLVCKFNAQYDAIREQVLGLSAANQLLISTRDLLLPRLVSGKLRVDELDIQFPPSMHTSA